MSPVGTPRTFRTTTRPVTVNGVDIPAGSKVRVVYASANRDDKRFADASQFRIDRARHRCMSASARVG
ncbi:MAG: cytochrome P450 [Pseudonocardia sp.]